MPRRIVLGSVTVGLGLTDEEARDAIRRLEIEGCVIVSYVMRTIPAYLEITTAGLERVGSGGKAN